MSVTGTIQSGSLQKDARLGEGLAETSDCRLRKLAAVATQPHQPSSKYPNLAVGVAINFEERTV